MLVGLSWKVSSIVFTILLSFVGNYGCVSLLEQYRLATREFKKSTLLGKRLVLVLMFSVFGCVSLCGTQTVGITTASVTSSNRDQDSMNHSLQLSNMIGGIVLLFIATFLGMYSSLYAFGKGAIIEQPEVNIMERFIKGAKQDLSSSEEQKSREKSTLKTHGFYEFCTIGISYILVGGCIIGAGLIGSLWLSFCAIKLDDQHLKLETVPAAFFGFCILSIFEGIVTLIIIFKVLVLFPYHEGARILCVSVMTLLVTGSFFVGCKSLRFNSAVEENDKASRQVGSVVDAPKMFRWFVTAGILCLSVVLMLAVANMRTWYQRLAMIVTAADASFEAISSSPSSKQNFIEDYEALRNIDGTRNDMEKIQKKRRSKTAKVSDSPRDLDQPVGTGRRNTDPGSPSSATDGILSKSASCDNAGSGDERVVCAMDSNSTDFIAPRLQRQSALFVENTNNQDLQMMSMKQTILQTTSGLARTASTVDTNASGYSIMSRGSFGSTMHNNTNGSNPAVPMLGLYRIGSTDQQQGGSPGSFSARFPALYPALSPTGFWCSAGSSSKSAGDVQSQHSPKSPQTPQSPKSPPDSPDAAATRLRRPRTPRRMPDYEPGADVMEAVVRSRSASAEDVEENEKPEEAHTTPNENAKAGLHSPSLRTAFGTGSLNVNTNKVFISNDIIDLHHVDSSSSSNSNKSICFTVQQPSNNGSGKSDPILDVVAMKTFTRPRSYPQNPNPHPVRAREASNSSMSSVSVELRPTQVDIDIV